MKIGIKALISDLLVQEKYVNYPLVAPCVDVHMQFFGRLEAFFDVFPHFLFVRVICLSWYELNPTYISRLKLVYQPRKLNIIVPVGRTHAR